MTIIHRRVFFGKVGVADQLVQHLNEGTDGLRRYGVEFKMRVLTDYMSGRSDRVAAEWEVEELKDVDSAMEAAMESAEAQAFFGQWMQKLNELITHSEADNWTVRQPLPTNRESSLIEETSR